MNFRVLNESEDVVYRNETTRTITGLFRMRGSAGPLDSGSYNLRVYTDTDGSLWIPALPR